MHIPSSNWKAIASGTASIPKVGLPFVDYAPSTLTQGDEYTLGRGNFNNDTMFASRKRAEDAYCVDPHPEFFYASTALATEEYVDDGPAVDSESVALSSSHAIHTDDEVSVEKASVTTHFESSNTVLTYDHSQPTGLFSRVKSWLGTVASGISRLCKRICLL